MGNTLLLIFLFLQVFIMGALTAVAVRYAYAHFKPTPNEPEPQQPPQDYLPPAVKEHLFQASQAQFQSALKRSAAKLQHDLDASGEHINTLVIRLATEIVAGEMENYRVELSRLHNQANDEMSGISKEVAKHQDELKARIAQEVEAEKQHLIKQIDTKLADAVGSFLLETLQHNVDLGNQSSYLIAMLEEHKADFVREVADETKLAK